MVRTRRSQRRAACRPFGASHPLAGQILSHDYVEAALLARAGWLVRLDTDLGGSFEEGPDNLIEFAKRDRRWCQGNLQHVRLLGAPRPIGLEPLGLRSGHIGLYLVADLGGVSGFEAGCALFCAPARLFPQPYQLFPVFPDDQTSKAIMLLVGIFGLLILPKLLIFIQAVVTGRAGRFGGGRRAAISVFAEILTSSVIAPVMLLFQTRCVLQVMTGIDGGWPATQRGSQAICLPMPGRRAAGWW